MQQTATVVAGHRETDQRSRRALLLDGVVASVSEAGAQFLPLYLVVLGASTFQLAALPVAGGLLGLVALAPGARLARRTRSPRRVVLVGGGICSRALLVLMAVLPVLVELRLLIPALLLAAAIRQALGMLVHPAWVTVFARVVGQLDIGQYAARRNLAIGAAGMVAAPLAGLFVSRLGDDGYPAVLLVAALVGFVSTAVYARIAEIDAHEPGADTHDADTHGADEVPERVASTDCWDGPFRRFLSVTLLMHVATMVASPYLVAYMARDLGASPTFVGAMSAVLAGSSVFGQWVAKGLVARVSAARLFGGGLLMLPLVPIAWLLVTAPWQAGLPFFISGTLWGVLHLTSFDLLIGMSSERSLPARAAAHQAAIVGGALLGPLIGAALAEQLGMRTVFVGATVLSLCAVAVHLMPAIRPLPRPAWRALSLTSRL